MPEGLGNLFSGLMAGFGREFLNYREKNFQSEQEAHKHRLDVVGKMLSDPTLKPEAKNQLLTDLQQMNKSGSKEEKAAWQQVQKLVQMGIGTGEQVTSEKIPGSGQGKEGMKMSSSLPVADSNPAGPTGKMIQESLPVASGNLTSSTPTEAPAPTHEKRMSAFYNPEEMRGMRATDIKSELETELSTREPYQMRMEKTKEEAAQSREETKANARIKAAQMAREAKVNLNLDQATAAKIASYTAEYGHAPSPDIEKQLRGEAGDEIQELSKAKVSDLKQRAINTKAKLADMQTRTKAYIANIQSSIGHRNVTEAQNQQRIQLSGIANNIKAVSEEINKEQAEFEKWVGVRGSTKFGDVAREAEQRMKAIEDRLEENYKKLNKVGSQIPEATTPKKMSQAGGGGGKAEGSIVMHKGKKIRIKRIENGKIVDYEEVQ